MRFAFLMLIAIIGALVSPTPRALASCNKDGPYGGARLTDVLDGLLHEEEPRGFAVRFKPKPQAGPAEPTKSQKLTGLVVETHSDRGLEEETPAVIVSKPPLEINRPPAVSQRYRAEHAYAPDGIKLPINVGAAPQEEPRLPVVRFNTKRASPNREELPALTIESTTKTRADTTGSPLKNAVKRASEGEVDEIERLLAAALAEKAKAKKVFVNGREFPYTPKEKLEGEPFTVVREYAQSYTNKGIKKTFKAKGRVQTETGAVEYRMGYVDTPPQPILDAGDPADVYAMGEPTSGKNPVPKDFDYFDEDIPFTPPPPFPAQVVEFLEGDFEARAAALLHPEMSAIEIGDGASSVAFAITSKRVPSAVQTMSKKDRAEFGLEIGERILKVRKKSENPDPALAAIENRDKANAMRLDWMMMHLVEQACKRARRLKQPNRPVCTVSLHDGKLFAFGASEHDIVRGPSGYETRMWLDELASSKTAPGRKQEILSEMRRWEMSPAEEIPYELGAVEEMMRRAHRSGINYLHADSEITLSPIRSTTAPDGKAYQEFIDGLGGVNVRWNPKTKTWEFIDY